MASQDRLVLRKRGYKQFEGKGFWLLTGLMTIPFLFVISALFIPFENEFIAKFAESIYKQGSVIAVIQFSIPLIAMVIMRFTMRATLILDDTGIIYFSGIPEKYQWVRMDWKVRWGDISAIIHKKQKMVNPRLSRVTIHINKKTVHIVPWQWIDPNDPNNQGSLINQLILSNKKQHQQVEESPVMKFLIERGLLKAQPHFIDPADTLNSNRKAQIIAVLFILSIFYFIGDVFFGLSEYYVPTTPWYFFVLIGCVGIFPVYQILKKEGLRKHEMVLMAVLSGIGIGLISYPLSIHANQWVGGNDLNSYTYELREGSNWYPVDSEMPILNFDRRSQYWAKYKVGDQKLFELRQGAFGTIQINMAPIYEDQEIFYEEKYQQEKKKKIDKKLDI